MEGLDVQKNSMLGFNLQSDSKLPKLSSI
jgi:hypothetical protein